MELKDYTTEELKAELDRRKAIAKAQKEAERASALRCRNCKHRTKKEIAWYNYYFCAVRTYGKTVTRHYSVKPSQKACDKFERKDN